MEKLMNSTTKEMERADTASANRDPITGAPGAHPVGTGLGAAAGGVAAGAAVGAVAGPLGAIAGAVVGAVVGGLAGKGVAEMIDPTREDAYWRENYASRPYVTPGSTYDEYGPAYRFGVDKFPEHQGRRFEDVESTLRDDWVTARGTSTLGWDRARDATRDSWQRLSDTVERAVPGDSDRDGK
jgi:hypothetical protein